MSDWIKAYRQIREWRYYTDANTYRLFTHLLYGAAWKPMTSCEIDLLPGQLITGRKVLARELRLSEQQIRTSLSKLRTSREITIKATSRFSIITVCKWNNYQSSETADQPIDQPSKQPTDNQQITTLLRSKEVEKKREVKFSPPTLTEVIEFFLLKGSDEQTAKKAFDHYDIADWINTNGKPVGSWKQTMLTNWINSSRSYVPNGKTILSESQPFKQLER